MTSKTRSPQKGENSHNHNGWKSEDSQGNARVLMPREYYDLKHPWFGSQIHYTIDVFRQLIRDARDRKQHSSNNGG